MTTERTATMRVCLATTTRGPGGVWRHVCDLAEGLRSAGVQVRIDVPTDAEALVADATRRGFPIADRLAGDDIYHAHLANTYDRRLTYQMAQARRRGSSVVIAEHLPRTDASDVRLAVRPPRPGATAAKTALKQAQIAMASMVIAVSHGSAGFLADRYRIPPTKLRTVFNGVQVSAESGASTAAPTRTAEPPSPVPVVFAATGSVIYQKGFDLLVDAAELATRDWRVDVWGEGLHRAEFAERSAPTVCSDGTPRVAFRGWTNDPTGEVVKAAALVMPSRWEAMPYSALEAMALSKPVIGTAVDGLTDAVLPGRTGVLVEPSAGLLAAAIDGFCDHLDQAEAMGRAGFDRVSTKFTAAAMVAATIEAYEYCLGRALVRSRT